MPATVSQVATGLAANLATITGLRTSTRQPEQLNPPFAFPTLTSLTYHGAMGGGNVIMEWTVTAIVGRWVDRNSYTILDGYLSYSGVTSLRAAIESDSTLGGVARTLVVTSARNISAVSNAEAEFLEIQLQVTVHA